MRPRGKSWYCREAHRLSQLFEHPGRRLRHPRRGLGLEVALLAPVAVHERAFLLCHVGDRQDHVGTSARCIFAEYGADIDQRAVRFDGAVGLIEHEDYGGRLCGRERLRIVARVAELLGTFALGARSARSARSGIPASGASSPITTWNAPVQLKPDRSRLAAASASLEAPGDTNATALPDAPRKIARTRAKASSQSVACSPPSFLTRGASMRSPRFIQR